MFCISLAYHRSSDAKSPGAGHGRSRQSVKRRRSACPAVEPLEVRTLLNAGSLDTTFGGTGMVTTTIGASSVSNAVAVQSDSKVVVVGWSVGKTKSQTGGPFTVVRYNTNGSLDSTFGSGGVVVVPVSGSVVGYSYAVAIQATDGKILVAGTVDIYDKKIAGAYYSEFALARLNTNRTLDKTFGGGTGYVTTSLTPELYLGQNLPESIAVQANGQIVVGGALGGQTVGNTGFNGVAALVRYNTNGSLDTTYGTGGEVIITNISVTTMAIDGSGRIDVAGGSQQGQVVARYLANGTLDSTFGTGGVSGPMPLGVPYGIGLQSTGNIVVCGSPSGANSGQEGTTLVRLTTNGSLDTTFGANGVYTDTRLDASSLVIQPTDDKIVAVGFGWVNGQPDYNFWVTRVLANGSAYDSTFGTNGLAEANFNNNGLGGGPGSVAPDPSGRILVTGTAEHYNGTNYSESFATARFLGDSTSTMMALGTTAVPSTTIPSDSVLMSIMPDDALKGNRTTKGSAQFARLPVWS